MAKSTTVKQLFKDASMAATVYSQWMRTDMGDQNIHLFWLGTSTPVGAFTVELSDDPIISTEKDRIVGAADDGTQGLPTVSGSGSAAKVVDITASITPVFGTGFTVNNGTNAGSTMFAMTGGQARYFRIKYTRTSGGAAGTLQGQVHGI